jgi:hypothetical protein
MPSDTLWQPGRYLDSFVGELAGWKEDSFYQLNNNVTRAYYWVLASEPAGMIPGSGEPKYVLAVCWFCNVTGERVA